MLDSQNTKKLEEINARIEEQQNKPRPPAPQGLPSNTPESELPLSLRGSSRQSITDHPLGEPMSKALEQAKGAGIDLSRQGLSTDLQGDLGVENLRMSSAIGNQQGRQGQGRE